MGLIYFTLLWVWGVWLADAVPEIGVVGWGSIALAGLIGWAIVLRWRRGWRVLFALVAAFGLGGLRMGLVPSLGTLDDLNSLGGLTVQGQVIAPPDVREARTLVMIEAQQAGDGENEQPVRGRVLAHVPRNADVQVGDTVRVTGRLVSAPRVDAFDYRDYLGRGGVGSLLINTSETVVIARPTVHPLAWLDGVRRELGGRIVAALPQPQAGLMVGVLLGDDRWIDPNTAELFNQSGAAHVLVVSGYNMTLVAGVLMALLSPIPWVGAVQKALAAWVGIAAYTVLVGAEPSTVRAAWMAGLVAIGQATGRQPYLPLSVAFSALMLTAYDPQLLWDRSFQLSTLATLGLAFCLPPLQRRTAGLAGLSGVGRGLLDLFLTTMSVLLFTVPLMALYSGQTAWAALSVNLLIVPVQAALLLIGLCGVLLLIVLPPVGVWVLWLCVPLTAWTDAVARAAASLPAATGTLEVSPALVLAYWFVIGGIAVLSDTDAPAWHRFIGRWRNRLMLVGLAGMCLAMVTVWGVARATPDGQLRVRVLDVAGGNAVLVQTPRGGSIVVDGGRSPNLLASALGMALPPNTSTIDVLILSAPDENEVAAWEEVAVRYPPRLVLTNGQTNLGAGWQRVLTRLTEAGATIQPVTTGYRMTTDDGVTVEVLWPTHAPELGEAFGVGGLALRVSYGEMRAILPANLAREAQAELLAIQPPNGLRADLLLVPNHGQARALDAGFFYAVNPRVAVIAAEASRAPDPDVLAFLGGREVLVTGERGTISVVTDGRTVSVSVDR